VILASQGGAVSLVYPRLGSQASWELQKRTRLISDQPPETRA